MCWPISYLHKIFIQTCLTKQHKSRSVTLVGAVWSGYTQMQFPPFILHRAESQIIFIKYWYEMELTVHNDYLLHSFRYTTMTICHMHALIITSITVTSYHMHALIITSITVTSYHMHALIITSITHACLNLHQSQWHCHIQVLIITSITMTICQMFALIVTFISMKISHKHALIVTFIIMTICHMLL